jgi:N-acyl-D-amino-acid deacylase
MSFDIIVRGGTVVDGTGRPPIRADLGITRSRICAIGALSDDCSRVIDATDRLVLPGFIDTHVHADGTLFDEGTQLAMLSQGVTTVVLGQDGLSFAPASAATIAFVERYFGSLNGSCPVPSGEDVTVASLLAMYDRRTRINVGYLVPLGTVRHAVMGPQNRIATPDELSGMTALVERGLADGALGVSSGLDYVPGKFAGPAELAALCQPLRSGGVYVTHMRGYEASAWVGLWELRAILSKTSIPAHISHLRGPAPEILGLLDALRDDNRDVTYDAYPYLRAASSLAMFVLPPWVGGQPGLLLEQLTRPDVREELLSSWFPPRVERFGTYTISGVGGAGATWAEGLAIADAAEHASMTIGEFLYDLLVASELNVGAVTQDPPDVSDEHIRALLRDDRHMGGSDGIYVGSHPHPRGWGAFARMLGRHTRDLGDWSWSVAAQHLAATAAARFGIPDRGTLAVSGIADVVVLDPATIADVASYVDPRSTATGVDAVLVSGEVVFEHGVLTSAISGRSLSAL